MTKKERKNIKIEFAEKNLLLVLCRRICTALIVLTIICVVGAIVANSYDDKVFSPSFQQTGGYVFVDYFFSKLLYGIFGNWSTKFYVITFLLMFVLIVLKIVLNTLYNIKWKNFINEKNNPTPKVAAPAVNSAPTTYSAPAPANQVPAVQAPVAQPAPMQSAPAPVQVTPVPVQSAPAEEKIISEPTDSDISEQS